MRIEPTSSLSQPPSPQPPHVEEQHAPSTTETSTAVTHFNSQVPSYIHRLVEKNAFKIESVLSVIAHLIFLLGHLTWTILVIPNLNLSNRSKDSNRAMSYFWFHVIIQFLEFFVFAWFIATSIKLIKNNTLLPNRSRFFIVNVVIHVLHLFLYIFACIVFALFISVIKTSQTVLMWLQVTCVVGFLGILWWLLSVVMSILAFDFWSRGVTTTALPSSMNNTVVSTVPRQHESYISIREEVEGTPSLEMHYGLTFNYIQMNSAMEPQIPCDDSNVEDKPTMAG
ncbi:hypothetical protein FDP41_002872 [Naegleria fowleri]|uniref:Uncharacterized protein n=1 Tax=Naegleria fowleri TaxID=5763 RepID=A0A6A5BMU4_NAEFO|nr:uncharacterized protein FDP41_002872 [Naegleria fowleri]KAF0978357.1 hypothetical protein FDP41_002872 [Naegleria fowleri]CAG4714049.1 unnamed protein product [Naegleria fowleri]